MTSTDAVVVARRYIDELWTGGKEEVAKEVLTEDFKVTDPGTPGRRGGIDGEVEAMRAYRAAFPDLHFTVDAAFASGDEAAVRWTVTGTHRGDLPGVPATGKTATMLGMSMLRFSDGKVAEAWHYWDALGMLRQLGAIPAS
jgi:steroid delta-isomerase-like uncharacterized protein